MSDMYWRTWSGKCPITNKIVNIKVMKRDYSYKSPKNIYFLCKYKIEDNEICNNCPVFNRD